MALLAALLAVGSPAQAQPARDAGAGGRQAAGTQPVDAPAFFKSSRDGWFWYQDPRRDEEDVAAPAPRAETPDSLTTDLANYKQFQRSVQDSLDAAVWNPSEKNLQRFLEIWAVSRRKASDFEDFARGMAVRMPWVDDTAQGVRPTNPAAQRVFDQVTQERNDDLMHSLAKTHGLYFFFRGDCAYCHALSPMLKQFEQKYGFTVFPVSLDGGRLPLFPSPIRDNGMAAAVMAKLGIPAGQFQVPFTVLAEPSTQSVLPIGFGPMTEDEMVERIALLVRLKDQASGGARGIDSAFELPPSPLPTRSDVAVLTKLGGLQ